MTNLFAHAINSDDGDRAAKLIHDALGIERRPASAGGVRA
jgi:hypothetical protein